ncbi:pectate lyase [Streptosporangium album]|uniref:Pectate lyase n=1 Tax=Streptosporangium album TaxID=47479 RepID=A0A7W7W6V7_9ACTN|nr:hypothetical protein [Streptosporangium album]MBB4936166.1 pectate lyase [Streptosporangium album]
MLLGHSDGNGGEDIGHLRVTYHHDWFDGTNHSVKSGAGDAGGSVASIPYSYSLDPAANVKSVVSAGAGAGRIAL